MWRPNSLREAINEDHGVRIDERGRAICPNCRTRRPPEVLIDVRHLPIPESFACDNCWTHWERTGRVVDGGQPITARFEWRRRWVVAHDAPPEIAQKFERMQQRRPKV